jgi:hypothetical protein
MEGQVISYSGEKYLSGTPTLDDIVAGNDEGLTAILEDALSKQQKIPFMAIENEGSTERINGTYRYVLCLYGRLINGQKALVTLKDIQVFFDILVPDGETPDECEEKVSEILSGIVKSFKMEHIKAFPFRGYYREKKPYLRIYTNGTGERKKAIEAVQDNNFKTASDDLYSFHQKVARENGIQLSEWSTINKYICKKGKRTSPLCPHEFYVSIKDFCLLEDFTTISDRFPISALLRDRTLVFTWDIETQSREFGEFAEVLDLNDNAFIICMTLHWKDDPKPLKQICLVDVETEPDPQWITIICGNQENLLKAFALCWRAFAPNIQVGFNDSDYDWRFIMERAYHLNILEWMWERMTGKFETNAEIIKWKYREKIGAKSENTFKTKNTVTKQARRIRRRKNIWAVELRSKSLRKRISFPVFLNSLDAYQLTYECASKNVSLILKSKKEAHLNSSYESAVLILRPTCHTIKCGKSIQRRKKAPSCQPREICVK